MVTDDQVIAEVRAVLHDEVADVTASPALLAHVRRRHARRVVGRRLVLTVAAVAAVAVAVVPADVPDTEEPANAAHVKRQTAKALDGVLESVVYERAVVTKGDKYSEPGQEALYERWQAADGSTFRLLVTIAGKPVVDLSRDTVADVFVDHRDHTYRARQGTEMGAPEHDDLWTPKEIQMALARGDMTVVGPGAPVNGKPTLLLRMTDRDLWVDTVTYLPVRWEWRQENSTPFDVEWLPPTPETLARLTTRIPPGYTRVE
jgi:hypothetical protein